MNLINETEFKYAHIAGRLDFPKHSLTLTVKGSFDLSLGQKAIPADKQLSPTGDEFHPDDNEQKGSLRYESDFAYSKPKTDLLLVGKCHAPGSNPVPACPVTFRVGSRSKTLTIFGNRRWKIGRALLHTITDPEPFTEMELTYENGYGGEDYKKNPVGKGYGKQEAGAGDRVRLLPNIEDPDDLISSPFARPEPAGFGPLGRMWQHRFPKMGTYKGKYLKERWPWFAEDFDWSHFNAAPPAMQVDGYLRGDEELYFENLHPEHPQYESRLPGLRVRCFVNTVPKMETGKYEFREVPMNLDTLWVDMESEKLVLVWRGWTEVLSEEFEEVRNVFIMSEPVEQKNEHLSHYYQMFLAALEEEEKKWKAEPEKPPEEPEETEAEEPEPEPEAPEEAEPDKTEKIDPAVIKAQTAAFLAQAGIDIDSLPPEARAKMEEQQDRIINKLTEEDPAKVMEMERTEMEKQMEEAFAKMGIDVNNPPPVSNKAKAEQVRFLKEMGIKDTDMLADPDMARFWTLTAAVFPKMGIDPENLDPLIEEAKKRKLNFAPEEEEEKEEEAGKGGTYRPFLTREIVEERAARGESFAGEDLCDLDLSGLSLKEIDFSGAMFVGTLLSNADLSGANLAGANLEVSDLSESNLSNANLEGADLSGANLIKTDLSGSQIAGTKLKKAVITGAILSSANLSKTEAEGADFSGADLTRAVLREAVLDRAKLDAACLKEAYLTGASLNKVKMSRAVLNDAVFEKVKMTDAVLSKVEAKDASFSEADLRNTSFTYGKLSGADFSKSLLDNVNFRGADLREASVEGAKGTGANFARADITKLRASEGCNFSHASFIKAVGTESMWEKADLSEADFSYSTMEGAFFIKANMEKANLFGSNMKFSRFTRANLKEAKLVQMNLFQGSLEKADLTRTDMTGSNMYAVEFLDAVFKKTVIVDTNLKMTKLAKV